MVAVIKTGHSIHRIVNYNENKVKEGVAECIGAANYPVDPEKMSINLKLKCLSKQIDLNPNVKRNSVHISLNFDVSESHLSKAKLLEITDGYMVRLGFGKQPYLVYQHHDAGHPHVHIVTTNIEADGARIDLHHLGIRKSEPARKEIEKIYELVRADEQKKQVYKLGPISAQRVQYGKSPTKRAIQNVLDHVVMQYKYTSLPELNAVLKQYNVLAERGSENSRVFRHKGLLYRVLDKDGKPVGVPIKASTFYSKPTLSYLEEKFREHETIRLPHKARVKNAVDRALFGQAGMSIQELKKALESAGVNVVIRKNNDGLIYGITYVDHRTKCIFNGSSLGKQYSVKAILERCRPSDLTGNRKESMQAIKDENPLDKSEKIEVLLGAKNRGPFAAESFTGHELGKILDKLIEPEETSVFMPYQLKRNRRKKKKKRGISGNQ